MSIVTYRRNHAHLTGFLLAFAFVFPSFIWIKVDRRIWPWDQAWYGEVTADLYYTLIHNPAGWFEAMRTMLPSKPPLISWLGQLFIPLGVAIGDIDFALLFMVVLLQAISLWIVWLAGRKICQNDNWLALLGVSIVASAPLFVGMSHQYFVEPLQLLVVSVSFYLALIAGRLRIARLFIILSILIVAGFAAKTTTVAYCGLAWLLAFATAVQRLIRSEKIEFSMGPDAILILIFTACSALTTSWYIKNLAMLLIHVKEATSSDTAELYGHHGSIWAKLNFWLPTINDALFLYRYLFLSCIAFIALAFILFIIRTKNTSIERSRLDFSSPDAVCITAFAHIIVILALLSSQINEESRFLTPIIAPFSLTMIWAIRITGLKRMAIPLSVLALTQLIFVNLEANGLISARLSNSSWLLPIKPTVLERKIADGIESETCQSQFANRYNIIGVEYPSMNANSLGYESAKARIVRGYRCYYTGLGYAETNLNKAIERIDAMKVTFIVLPRVEELPKSTGDVLNAITAPISEYVRNSDKYTRLTREFGIYQIYERKE